jgi:uncharacterized delta-60 repeat protein
VSESAIRRRLLTRGAGVICALAAGVGAAIAVAASGGLDPSFGTAGTVLLDRPTSTYPTPVMLVAGGKSLFLTSANNQVVVSRLLPDGAPDPTFDGDGQAVITGTGSLSAYGLAVEPDGRIVVVGSMNLGAPGADAMVWRLKADGGSGLPNGALDQTFDTDGAAELNFGTEDTARAVAIQPDGRIVVAGTAFTSPGPTQVVVWRLKADGGSGAVNGALDPSFDTDGAAGINDGTSDLVNAIALAPDGRIVLAGATELAVHGRDAAVWRVKADGGAGALNGALDPSFDTDGQADVESGGEEAASDVALQPDGKIVLAGFTDNAPHGGAAMVWRLNADGGSGATNGALDPSFDGNGAATISGGGFARGAAVALQPDGKILLAGSGFTGTNPSAAILWRLNPDGGPGPADGALDPTFGAGGAATAAAGSGAGADAIALAADRRVLVAGATFGGTLLAFRALGDPFGLTVARAGAGAGSVQSAPAGIDCGGSCSAPFDDGLGVTLKAAPAAGSTFAGWSGAGCGGTGDCVLTMEADRAVTATFDATPVPPPPRHFALKAARLGMKAFRRAAKRARALVTGLPVGSRISGSLVGRRKRLARATATAGAAGRARLTFRFAKAAHRRLRSKKLKSVTLKVTARPPGDSASSASRRVKLKRARRSARRAAGASG